MRRIAIGLALLVLPGTVWAQLRSEVFVSGLSLPVAFVQDPTNSTVQYVVQQGGRIRVIRNGVLQTADFLNLTGSITSGGERGLLGMAFAPDSSSGRVFVNFTNPQGHTVVARFKRSASDPSVADPNSRFDLRWGGAAGLRYIVQPFSNHNGGHLAFGPDGYLYIGLGDGGSGNDPAHRAQDPNTLLGKMLRIDVNVPDGHVEGYVVPPDNPFLDGSPIAALPEIWAFGLRNPWRYNFDDPSRGGTGALFIGDVGQNAWEEISYEPPNRGGRNHGWRNREGAHNNVTSLPPAYQPLIDPIHEYESNGAAVTGGFVYRGTLLGGAYRGRYFFGEYVERRLWSIAITVNAGSGEAAASDLREHTAELGGSATLGNISSFGLDASGELYVLNYSAGRVLRILPVAAPTTATPGALDFDGDGRGDAFRYASSTGAWSIEYSNGAGGFTSRAGVWSAGWRVQGADFDGDGFSDIFLYNPSNGTWFKAINNRAGDFTYFSARWSPGWETHVVDLNADGKSDVFLYDAASGMWFKCVSTGTGTGEFQYSSGSWLAGWSLYPADFNSDGMADLFLYNRSTGVWFRATNDGVTGFTYAGGTWSAGWDIYPGDFNGDNRSDLFLYMASTGQWFSVLFNGADFSYVPGSWSASWTIRAGNFNGDARRDLFLYSASTGQWFECFSDGAGNFSYATGSWSPGWDPHVTDFNADRVNDLLLHNPSTGVWSQATISGSSFTYGSGTFNPGWTVVASRPRVP